MPDVTDRDREMLADEYEASGFKEAADCVREGSAPGWCSVELALRAIARARAEGKAEGRVEGMMEGAEVAQTEADAATAQVREYDAYGGPELSGRKAEAQRAGAARAIAERILARIDKGEREGS